MYRIVRHGDYGNWYRVQRRVLFFWVTLESYIDTYDEAETSIRLLKTSIQ